MLIKYSADFSSSKKVISECIENFKNELFLEAKVLDVEKTPLKMSQSDADFLYQFDPRWWKQAAMQRFEMLYKALAEREEVRKVYYDKLYDYQIEYAKKELERSPILKFLSSDVQDALIKNTAHRRTLERISKIADPKFWNSTGKKYEQEMDFVFSGQGGKQITYSEKPYIKELIDTIEGQVGQKGGIDLSNPHDVEIKTVTKDGETKVKIRKRTNGFEFPEEDTINNMQKKWLMGIANGILSSKKITNFMTKDKTGKLQKNTIVDVPSSKVFEDAKMKINDSFAFDHEQKRIFKSLRKIFNRYKDSFVKAKTNEEVKSDLLQKLISDLKYQLPFLSKFPSCSSFDDCEKFFHDITLDSRKEIYSNVFEAKDKNFKSADLGIPDKFFHNESILISLMNFLAAKQLVEWAKKGELKNSNDEPILFDDEKQDLIFPELKLPTFKKELTYKQKVQASKGGGHEIKTKTVDMPVLMSGGFVKEHDEDDPEHAEMHKDLPKRGFLYNPRTKQKEHRFVGVDSLEKAGHQGTDHDRFGSFHPTQNIAGVEFLDIRSEEIQNRLQSLIGEEGLCKANYSTKNGKTRITFTDASHTDKDTMLCGVAKTIYNNLTGGSKMDERDLSEENENALYHFPMLYKMVILNILNNLNSNRVRYENQRNEFIRQLVNDFKQHNIGGKGKRKTRTTDASVDIIAHKPPESKNALINLINSLKYNMLVSCSSLVKGACVPCNPEDHTCEIKAMYPIEKVVRDAQVLDQTMQQSDKNLKPSNLENIPSETEKIEKMLVALAVAKEYQDKPKENDLKNIDEKIKTKAKEIHDIFANEKNKTKSMADTVKKILRLLGIM